MSDAQSVHIPNLTIQYFPKTQEGQALVAGQEVFCLDGKLYQGYKGNIATVQDKQLTDDELETVHDVDSTKDRVWADRAGRAGSRKYRKDEELSRREEAKRDRKLKDLELAKLEHELGVNVSAGNPQTLVGSEAQSDTVEAVSPELVMDKAAVSCETCGKVSPDGHKRPHMWLNGHMMGAHKDKNK